MYVKNIKQRRNLTVHSPRILLANNKRRKDTDNAKQDNVRQPLKDNWFLIKQKSVTKPTPLSTFVIQIQM